MRGVVGDRAEAVKQPQLAGRKDGNLAGPAKGRCRVLTLNLIGLAGSSSWMVLRIRQRETHMKEIKMV